MGKQNPFREEILAIVCVVCGAEVWAYCDRSGDFLTAAGHALAARGTPPSHQVRKLMYMGHSEIAARDIARRESTPFRGGGKRMVRARQMGMFPA